MAANQSNTGVTELRVAAAGRWQWLTVVAGLALAATFFVSMDGLRVLPSRGATDSPLTFWIGLFHGNYGFRLDRGSFLYVMVIAALAGFAHLLGLAMAVFSGACLLRMCRVRKVAHACGVGLGVAYAFGCLVAVGLALPMVWQALSSSRVSSTSDAVMLGMQVMLLVVLPVLGSLIGLAYLLIAARRGRYAYLYHGFFGAALLVFVHAITFALAGRRFLSPGGLSLAALSCILLLVARIGEARAVVGVSWRRTILYLLTLRLHKAARPVGHCPACGYNLYGLREMRCPECGRAFTFEEINATPDAIGYVNGGRTAAAPLSPRPYACAPRPSDRR